ncbi:MAG: hypothetical protein FWJ92_03695 [Actinomycetes bacterium]
MIALFWVLVRQQHPADDMAHVAGPDDQGPTDDPYPPGSNPAGPGAEIQADPQEPLEE